MQLSPFKHKMLIQNLEEIYHISEFKKTSNKITFSITPEQNSVFNSFKDTIFVTIDDKISITNIEVLDDKPKKTLFEMPFQDMNAILNDFIPTLNINALPKQFTLANALFIS